MSNTRVHSFFGGLWRTCTKLYEPQYMANIFTAEDTCDYEILGALVVGLVHPPDVPLPALRIKNKKFESIDVWVGEEYQVFGKQQVIDFILRELDAPLCEFTRSLDPKKHEGLLSAVARFADVFGRVLDMRDFVDAVHERAPQEQCGSLVSFEGEGEVKQKDRQKRHQGIRAMLFAIYNRRVESKSRIAKHEKAVVYAENGRMMDGFLVYIHAQGIVEFPHAKDMYQAYMDYGKGPEFLNAQKLAIHICNFNKKSPYDNGDINVRNVRKVFSVSRVKVERCNQYFVDSKRLNEFVANFQVHV